MLLYERSKQYLLPRHGAGSFPLAGSQPLGEALVGGLRDAGNKIFSGGSMEMDLTQTSYSTVPSVDIELGDKGSSHSDAS